QTFGDLAAALTSAARVVQTGGRIILLSTASPDLGPAGELVRRTETPEQALSLLRKQKPPEMAAAFQWAAAARHARIYWLGGVPHDLAEELFVTPLDSTGQVARLIGEPGSYLVLNDAHKSLAVVA